MKATNTPFKTFVLSAAVTLALGLGANVGQAAVTTTGGNFSMLTGTGGPVGGTNDVVFSWDETFRYSVPASGNVSNATISSVTTFFGNLWTASDVTIYGPGTYTFDTNCPAGEPGCIGSTANYQPKLNFNGSDSFTYTLVDARGGAATATVNVTVTPVNDVPVANKDIIVTSQNNTTPVTINPLLNDTDVDGNPLTVTAKTNGTNGLVTFTATSVSYTPTGSYFGIDSFTYTASDGNGGNTVGTVYVGVNQTGNIPPAVGNASITVGEDLNGTTLPPGIPTQNPPPLTIIFTTKGAKCDTSFANPRLGFNGVTVLPAEVSCQLSGVARAKDLNGTDSFTYVITDGRGGIDTSIANVTITPVNDPPVVKPDALITSQGNVAPVTINPLVNDTDVENNPLTVTAKTDGTNGLVTFTATSVSYTPTGSFSGIDSFTYTVSDGALTASGTVNVAVNATGNNPPVAVNDSLVVNEDSILTTTTYGFNNMVYALKNDSDPENDKLKTIAAVSLTANGTSSFVVSRDLTITVNPNQVGGHMLFEWNGNLRIDLVNVWNMDSVFGTGVQMINAARPGSDPGTTTTDSWSGVATTIWDGASTDDDGNGTLGIAFVDGPFPNFNGNFNFMGLRPVVAPTSNAGTDSNVIPGTLVTLTGTCTGPDTLVTNCAWTSVNPAITLTPSPATGIGTNSASATATFTAPAETVPATAYPFTLTNTDNVGITATDQKTVTVAAIVVAPPTVNAGPDQTTTSGTPVNLSGTCAATQSLITGCTWTTSDPLITLTLGGNLATATASFTAPTVALATPVTFTLTGIDDNVSTPTVTDTLVVTVNPTPPSGGGNTVVEPTPNEVSNKKNALGCTLSPEPIALSQRGEWWLIAGFMAWMGVFRKRAGVGKR